MLVLGAAMYLAAPAVHAAAPPPSPEDTRTMAIEAYRRGDLPAAIAHYEEIAAREPWNPEIRGDLIWLLFETEQYARCAEVAREILDLDEGDRDAHNLLGQSLHRMGRYREAIAAYDAALARWPEFAALRLSQALAWEALREFDVAADSLGALLAEHPEQTDAHPAHARVLSALQRHKEAAAAWTAAADAFPDRPAYRFASAEARFRAGDTEPALDAMAAILAAHPDLRACRDFLTHHAMVAGDLDAAIAWQAAKPRAGDDSDASDWVRLAALQLQADRLDDALESLEAALSAAPGHGEAMLLQAEILRLQQRPAAAARMFAAVTDANPWCWRAWRGLAGAHRDVGDTDRALASLRRVRELDPTDPYLLLEEAQLLYAQEEREAARQMLEDWLAANPSPALPVLLYHGLTQREDDPLLASRVHMTTRMFEDHMRALHETGYQAVTAEQILAWIRGDGDLPARPVWIAFDDGRLDSLREAAPILEHYGLHAAMFVAGINADRNLPGYATWEELAAYRESGVWELQSHGDLASSHLPVSPTGRTELFLPYRQWMEEQHRLESEQEWKDRIAADYAAGRQKGLEHIGAAPIAFAWPEGHFGQEAVPNAPAAAPTNLALAESQFPLAFHQDRYGMNPRSRAPTLLTRREPDPRESGADLVRRLQQETPHVMMRSELLNQAVRDRDADRARDCLETLRRHALPDDALAAHEMRVLFLEGDFEAAADQAQRVIAWERETAGATTSRLQEALNTRGWALQQQNRFPEALAAWRESLRVDAGQVPIWVATANILEQQRQYGEAADVLDHVRRTIPDSERAAPSHARVLGALGRHAEAARAWAAASAAYPEQPDYQYFQADATFRAGQTAEALDAMQKLLTEFPDHAATRQFLVGHALATGDTRHAIHLLEAAPEQTGQDAADHGVRLAGLHLRVDDLRAALAALDRALDILPGYPEARLLKAEILLKQDQPADAVAWFESVTDANPDCLRAWVGLSDARQRQDRPEEALAAIRRARALDPTDPYLLEREAGVLYGMGDQTTGRRMLETWLETDRGPSLPVLLYHGLTTRQDDPMLASRIHLTTHAFENHLRALRRAGYQSVTAKEIQAWLSGQHELPEHAVWITFDDGRRDSLELATPLLKRYGFRAAMFVAGWNADRNLQGYATWEELAHYQADGTWELQSHGDRASSRIPLDAAGTQGLFLPNRRWLEADRRLETEPAWLARIAKDYDDSRAAMQRRLGTDPIAFAWPEGNFGQIGIPTAPAAATHNLALARERFALGFRQDAFGINTRARDPMLLSRLEPDPAWSGDDLLRHLADQQPGARFAMQLLKQATWEARLHEARRWITELERRGASQPQRLLGESLVRSAAGQQAGARALIHEALELDPHHQASYLLDTIERRDRSRNEAGFRYWEDDDDRSSLIASLSRQAPFRGDSLWTAGLLAAQHREQGLASIEELAPSVGLRAALSLHHTVGASLTGHTFSEQPDNRLSGSGAWRAQWTDTIETEFTLDRNPVYTVRALNANLYADRVQLAAWWQMNPQWQVSARASLSSYNDDNERSTLATDLVRRFPEIPGLGILLQLRYDDTSDEADEYYTPNDLVIARVGVDYSHTIDSTLSARLRYVPGYGVEQNQDDRILHAGHVDLSWRPNPDLEIRPSVNLQRTPTYFSSQAALSLIWQL